MATTIAYKDNLAHRNRVMTTEDDFSVGMRTTNAPLDSGYVKTMCNYVLKNDGAVLTPRPALSLRSNITNALNVSAIHSTGLNSVKDFMPTEDSPELYTLMQYCLYAVDTTDLNVPMSNMRCTIETLAGTVINCTYVAPTQPGGGTPWVLTTPFQKGTQTVHGMDSVDASSPRRAPVTSISSNIFTMVRKDAVSAFARLDISYSNAERTAATWCLTPIDPKEIAPTQAVNYGYNMLKDNPYEFSNTQVATSEIKLMGVLPYDEQGNLLLSARPGQTINFKLFYKYPLADVTAADKYYTQWEIYDLSSSSSTVSIIQDITKSPLYSPGDTISLTHEPTLQSFGVIVKIYKVSTIGTPSVITTTTQLKTAITNYAGVINPEQTLTLASYYLTSTSNTSMLNMDTATYDLGTATGMCTWQQKVVIWGVANARNMLFVSEVNSPDYFPYPNNTDVFDDDIVQAIVYLGKLLVFTKSALYQLTLDLDGAAYTTKTVQERLTITEDDISTIKAIQNMVYFKSGNYYYMIVPKLQSLTGELQLAPVSRPIEQFLDNFKEKATEILKEIYNFEDAIETVAIDFVDNATYLAGTQVRNAYKLRIKRTSIVTGLVTSTKYIDFCLNYDTVLRSWTIHTYETGLAQDVIFKTTATGSVVHAIPSGTFIHLAVEDQLTAKDTHLVDSVGTIMYNNAQYLDTGFRKHSEQNKKRFREMQFSIGAITQNKLSFYTAFFVDSDERRSFYRSAVTHCTDPTSPNYGQVIVEQELNEPVALELNDSVNTPSVTMLDTEWVLDTSVFPELYTYKIRYHVSGKGYGGRMKLLSFNEDPYEMLNVNWVYRVMFAR